VARALSWLAVLTSVSILAVAGVGYALVTGYDGNIRRIPGIFGDDDARNTGGNGARTILIVGSDSRDNEAGERIQGKGSGFVTGQRADVIMLAHLYGSADKAQLVSIPRDSYVTIPAHTNPRSNAFVKAREGKINRALFEGGPALLLQTVQDLTGVAIDHYMQIDFAGFTRLVDELDGVEVCLSKPAKDPESGIDLQAGRQTIGGEQALAFVRQRNDLPRGDIDRIQRQQRLLGSLVREVLSARTLANPVKLNGVLDVATGSLQVDDDLTFSSLRQLALRFRSFSADDVLFTTAPIGDIAARRGGESVVLLDEDASDRLFGDIAGDVAPADAPPPPAAGQELLVAPDQIRVEVLNGAGVPGLGARAAADLGKVGFVVVGAPGNRPGEATGTVVRHGPDKADSARTLAAAVPGATVEEDRQLDRTLQLVVGSAYSTAVPVTVAGSAPPPPAEPAPDTASSDPCGI
jgi:LCP family protein required for cell wall assembly